MKSRVIIETELDEWTNVSPMLGLRMMISSKEDGVWIHIEMVDKDGKMQWGQMWNVPGATVEQGGDAT